MCVKKTKNIFEIALKKANKKRVKICVDVFKKQFNFLALDDDIYHRCKGLV